MNFSLLFRHQGLLAFVVVILTLAMTLCTLHGELKPMTSIEWLDVVGEGSVCLLTLCWIFAVMISRPPGQVTTLLVVGLTLFSFSALLDVIDEFTHYSNAATWLSLVESIPAAVGMVVMSYALYLWHQEQLALNRQLQRRELWYRSHEQIDVITQLYRADYWRDRASTLQEQGVDASVIVLDINDFSEFNLRYGHQEGDRFLREISQLIVMNLRAVDLACRYAGDRFVILLPDTGVPEARELADQLERSIRNVAFKSGGQTTAIFHSVRSACARLSQHSTLADLMSGLNRQLDETSRQVA
ncbi:MULTISPECIES: GGDEF domain-containing protein [Marisediminitalea]|jgi:diguanylate cyclase (GGDEF)-like protein|uniref:GGDEF domain-containing protein n=1 Tax=Marisediminitalea TaxID=2662254 RepID=UPI000C644853|nr:GGDEF domain-containing protein [Marisediminitalea aggregata]MAP20871.1 GGDEF domain-containing protein [Alteromonadaceae bacterium]MCP3864540.1 GGDEF domain-containing protein [Aestuariibacter sp.]MAX44422.1 GGDEF domain-containing protein [Alteromonadaceae bacterium]MCP4233314.1 GGDEF domain-containing protein [Aestuariibacter sp.]MCP4527950.1 GGDEF domain-containing protein [Aestuariibacter sp.]|tara:strand:- start:39886 stop:40785 length:900 start_codon:yes stop_codon:yes gene_type:complete